MRRYQRQIQIPGIGEEGQRRLAAAHVAVAGAGGLGSPVLTYLAEAGVGHITLIDFDTVSDTNLNRQFLHTEQDLGRRKTDSAREKLALLNSGIRVTAVQERLTAENACRLLGGADAAVSCLDSVAARLIVNEACIREGIPLVEGGIDGFYGFVTVVTRDGPCLACIGYHAGMDRQAPAAALGTTAGVIGSLQANECLKLLLGTGTPLVGRMLQYDGLNGSFDEMIVRKREDCPVHRRAEEERNDGEQDESF